MAILISSNALIIPTTVPVKPSIGAMVITELIQIMFFSRKAISKPPAFCTAFSISSFCFPIFESPAKNIDATGPGVDSQNSIALSFPESS